MDLAFASFAVVEPPRRSVLVAQARQGRDGENLRICRL